MSRVGIYGYAAVTDSVLYVGDRKIVWNEEGEKQYLTGISLKSTSQLSRNLGVAVKAAMEESPLKPEPEQLGVIMGSSLGSSAKIADFHKVAIESGPDMVSPMEFPSTVANAPSSLVGIWFKLKGPCIALSNGDSSALDAISVAYDEIKYSGYPYFMAGGADQLTTGVEEGYAECYGADRQLEGLHLEDGAGAALVSAIGPEDDHYKAEIIDYVNLNFSKGGDLADRMLGAIRSMLHKHEVEPGDILAATTYRPYQQIQTLLEGLLKQAELAISYWNRDYDSNPNRLAANGIMSLIHAMASQGADGREYPYRLLFETSSSGKLSAVLLKLNFVLKLKGE